MYFPVLAGEGCRFHVARRVQTLGQEDCAKSRGSTVWVSVCVASCDARPVAVCETSGVFRSGCCLPLLSALISKLPWPSTRECTNTLAHISF